MSWSSLISIRDEARQMRQEDREKPIVDCPVCGFMLNVRGEWRDCPMGHYRQRGTTRGPESV